MSRISRWEAIGRELTGQQVYRTSSLPSRKQKTCVCHEPDIQYSSIHKRPVCLKCVSWNIDEHRDFFSL